MELADFNKAVMNDWLTGDMKELNTAVRNFLGLLELGVEDITMSEYEDSMYNVSEALEDLTNNLVEITELFVKSKELQAKADKKWEENV